MSKIPGTEHQRAEQPQPEQAGSAYLTLVPEEIEAILNVEARGLCVTSSEGTCRFVSQPLCELLGYSCERMLEYPVKEFIPFLDESFLKRSRQGMMAEEFHVPRRDGRAFPARIEIRELMAAGQSTGFAIFVTDLSEEKHVEEVLQKAERLASAGRMAAAIAHEINNPLEAVTNLLFLLRNQDLTPESTHLLSLAESEIGRVSRIARQTLAFYRENGKPARVDLRELLNVSVDVHAIREPQLRVHRRYRTAQTISGYATELQQVFHNIIANSIEAGATDLWLHLHRNSGSAPGRRGVRISIADNGCGIDPSVRSRIFNPFITTKGEKGTGLGLWVSRGMILRHEGSIRVRTSTRPGRTGTCISIVLPH
ncbi:MAG: ATP-binding protein [Acidobacteriaceae bacterium]